VVEKINGGCGAAADSGGDTAGHGQRFDNRWARDRARRSLGRGQHRVVDSMAGAAGDGEDGRWQERAVRSSAIESP